MDRRPAVQRQHWLDAAAMGASLLCLMHCLLLPTLLVAVPMLAAFLTLPESFHALAFAFAVPTSALALGLGYRRHRHPLPLAIAAVGLPLLGAGAFLPTGPWLEMTLSVTGALLLALGHAWNWRAGMRPATC
ncbi:MerC domain-containing protein [Sphingomonas sp. 3-13AW]|jgi:hypothetical protein|uniref:MerC domain-containing protein n=1 Tax=Sphingomonas sp. 3-13AW TaxID=3050450 RepID=UPI003BB74B85